MSVFSIDTGKCIKCGKCLRTCSFSAINITNQTSEIDSERCVECGKCFRGCSYGAINVISDLETAKLHIKKSGRKVILSLDPSCFGVMEIEPEYLVAGVKKLGFYGAADATEAARAVAWSYGKLIDDSHMPSVITSVCPVICTIVEKYYPDLVRSLSPLVSPMIAHGRILKQRFPGCIVVHVNNCHARLAEARDVRHSNDISAVLTYNELVEWLNSEHIDLSRDREDFLTGTGGVGVLYPLPTGVHRAIRKFKSSEELPHPMVVYGLDACRDLLQEIENGGIGGCLADLSACTGSCVRGNTSDKSSGFKNTVRLREYARNTNNDAEFIPPEVSLYRPLIRRDVSAPILDEKKILNILTDLGFEDKSTLPNCGACGYDSCRDKAISVLNNKSEPGLCLPSLKKRAERISNFIMDEIPMITIIIDESQKIIEFNSAAVNAFKISRADALKLYIFELIDPSDFQYVLDTGLSINNKRVNFPEYGLKAEGNIVCIQKKKAAMGLYRDITKDEAAADKRFQSRLATADMAQKVIENQMMVAQQIAGLLGETTAETKVILNRLKNQILQDGESQ